MTALDSMVTHALQYRPLYIMTGNESQQLLVYTDQITVKTSDKDAKIYFDEISTVTLTAPEGHPGMLRIVSENGDHIEFSFENSLHPLLQAKIIFGYCNRQMELIQVNKVAKAALPAGLAD